IRNYQRVSEQLSRSPNRRPLILGVGPETRNRVPEEILQTSRPNQQRRTVQPETKGYNGWLREYLRHKLPRTFPLDKSPIANARGQRTQSNYQRVISRALQRTRQL